MKIIFYIVLCAAILTVGAFAQQKKKAAAPKPQPDKTKVPELSADELQKSRPPFPRGPPSSRRAPTRFLSSGIVKGFSTAAASPAATKPSN